MVLLVTWQGIFVKTIFDAKKIIETLASSNLAEMQQSSVLVYGDFST